MAELLRQLQLHSENLHFFGQAAFSVMVRNGDAHLKIFGVLYRSQSDIWLATMFDVVTTAVYTYTRYPGGPELEDRTLALKLLAGRNRTKAYPTRDELLEFGRRICGVSQPAAVLEAIAEAMQETRQEARGDERTPAGPLGTMRNAWGEGLELAAG